MKKSFTDANRDKIMELDCFLAKNSYFSTDSLPGVGDALMFTIFDRESKFSIN